MGDFDGDGYDEVITYDRATGGSARVWSFDRRTGKFYERPEILGNLAGWQGFSGGGGALMFAGNFNDNDGFVRLDDLLVYNETTKQILVLEGRRPGGAYARLWVWYWSVLDVQPYEELSVATFASSASGFDNIVISAWTGQSAGTIRAYSAAWPLTYLPSYQGQIIFRPRDNFAGDVHLVWGDLGAWDPTRDDAIQFIPGKGLYYGFDAHPAGEWYYRFKQGIGYLKASLGL